MGQLRGVLNDLLATVPDLATVLARADAFAARTPGLMAATLAIAVLEPASGRVRYSVCGQPPPLTVASSGEVGFLDSGPSGPLGTGSAPNVAAAVLRPGELVVLYSDGLTALPGRTSAEALSELAAVAAVAVAAVAGAAGAAAGRLLSASPDAIAPNGE
jgi:serine phosphatase RsbU (regulator of sigma subunit)